MEGKLIISVSDPDPDPVGSAIFDRGISKAQVGSGFDKNRLDPDSIKIGWIRLTDRNCMLTGVLISSKYFIKFF
jgi:hypothetical protein